MKEAYIERDYFHKKSLHLIAVCDGVITKFSAMGFRLTLRQLYYQLVAANHIENTMRSYDKLGSLVNDARLAGLLDWDAIEDRTRGIEEQPRWESGKDVLEQVQKQYHQDMWATQDYRVFCVIEKEALAGIVEPVCKKWDIPLLSARGYPSVSALREIAKYRIIPNSNDGREIVVLHLGDHDPSGIDMSRDLLARFELLTYEEVPITFRRLALNIEQVKKYNPPPNPAKSTDSRFKEYARKFGKQSWELDSLSPDILHGLIQTEVESLVDLDRWTETEEEILKVKARLGKLAKNFNRKRRGK